MSLEESGFDVPELSGVALKALFESRDARDCLEGTGCEALFAKP